MKNRYFVPAVLALLVVVLWAMPTQAQTVLSQTTLAAAINGFPGDAQRTVTVASATGITANTTALFIPTTGEYMTVTAVSGVVISVIRGSGGTRTWPAANAAVVVVVPPAATVQYTPTGTCTRGEGLAQYQPVINTRTGDVSVCMLTGLWNTTNAVVYTPNSFNSTP